MIRVEDSFIILETKDLSYIIDILPSGKLEHVYLGPKTKSKLSDLKIKLDTMVGSQVLYSDLEPISLDLLPLEYSSIGKGDYRSMPLEVKMPNGSFVADFCYLKHEIKDGSLDYKLPHAKNATNTIIVTLVDKVNNVYLDLIYSSFYETNVFTRKVVLTNKNENSLSIRKIMSMMLDIYDKDYDIITFDGGWIKETNKHKRPVSYGLFSISSQTGASSNRHNAGFILSKKNTTEDYGKAIGFNLVYSGNHYSSIELANHGSIRVMSGINPHCFEWDLAENENFMTPEVVISYSNQGLNKLSHNMHNFINNHIIPEKFKESLRPIVINNWESHMFDYNMRKLLKLAKRSAKLGIEMFVLDDGWFGNRDNDDRGLGDYFVNKKKLPKGLLKLSKRINKYNMDFGLWFEPEMINVDSNLYRSNSNYVVQVPGLEPSKGRNQLVLDLCNKEVVSYIKNELFKVIDSANIKYIKWDMNRSISDMYSESISNQGMFFHKYILGLYDILESITKKYPDILLETCSSGGNRFDLGMLTFGPQIWASDNTDPISRLKIQRGLSYLYPLSTISAHVSQSPHSQTLRHTPLETRFNVASFGVLGYELDFKELKPYELKMIKDQIRFYKEHRRLFQFGTFYRFDLDDIETYQVSNSNTHILGRFQVLSSPSPNIEKVSFKGIKEDKMYDVLSRRSKLNIDRFGHLIKHAIKIPFKHDGFVMRNVARYYVLENAKEKYTLDSNALLNGFYINQQFMGTYYNEKTRLLGDYGSELYIAKEIRNGKN